jgi:hypothetical protein
MSTPDAVSVRRVALVKVMKGAASGAGRCGDPPPPPPPPAATDRMRSARDWAPEPVPLDLVVDEDEDDEGAETEAVVEEDAVLAHSVPAAPPA